MSDSTISYRLAAAESRLRSVIASAMYGAYDAGKEHVAELQRQGKIYSASQTRMMMSGAHVCVQPVAPDYEITQGQVCDRMLSVATDRLAADTSYQENLASATDFWRSTVIREIGEEKYRELNDRLKGSGYDDVAQCYAAALERDAFINLAAGQEKAGSSSEFALLSGLGDSLLYSMDTPSETDREVHERAKQLYNPSSKEKYAANLTSWVLESAPLNFSVFGAIVDTGFGAIHSFRGTRPEEGDTTVSQDMSQALFGDKGTLDRHSAGTFRNRLDTESIDAHRASVETSSGYTYTGMHQSALQQAVRAQNAAAKVAEAPAAAAQTAEEPQSGEQKIDSVTQSRSVYTNKTVKKILSDHVANGSLSQVGQDYLDDPANPNNKMRIGSLMASLPDLLPGLLSGNIKGGNLIPLALIFLACSRKVGVLPKFALLAFGLAGLLSNTKESQSAVARASERPTEAQGIRFKQYPEQPLDPRLADVRISNGFLFADIDGVPSYTRLTPDIEEAVRQGALPLSTLANNVLAKLDVQQAASREFDARVNAEQSSSVKMGMK